MNNKVEQYQTEAVLGEMGRLTVTTKALTHLQRQAAKSTPVSCALRIGMKKAGCSGVKYTLDYVNSAEKDDEVIVITPDFSIFVAATVWPYVHGSVIDYVQEGVNGRLKLNNPNETGGCGCGESVYFGDGPEGRL
jgi:iron-sulfur cluster assembly accessory protein